MYINFTIKAVNHNNKTPLFKFSPTEDIIAIASGSIVTIYSADGSKLDSFNTGETVLDLSWSENGEQLIVLSLNSHLAFIWRSKQRVSTKLTLDIEEPLAIAQSYKSNWVACGSSLGHLFLYDTFTAQKLTISSKHSKRIVSITFTHGSDYVVSLSPESIIVSNTSGETIAYLRQKQIGGMFVNRLTAAQIKTPEGAQDGIVVPVFFDQTIQKKNKAEITTDFTGLGLIIINVDKEYLSTVKQINDAYNLITSLKAQTYGNAYVQVPLSVENEAIIDLKYVYGQSGNFAPQICCLTTVGNIISFSVDHGRQDMAISTLDSKFKYFTVVNKRESKYCSQSATFQSYMSYITDLNSLYAVQEMSQGVSTYNSRMLQNLSPCTSATLLASCKDSSVLLTPNDKSIDQYDSAQTSQAEQIYIDFTGGKDSLGLVNNYPTNIGSSASGNMCFVAFANGSSMMILTKSVNQCMVSQFDQVTQITSSMTEGFSLPLHKNNGITLMNITSPKSAQIFKVMPAKYSGPVVGTLRSELIFNVEPQLMHIGQNSVAFYTTSSNQIFFSKLSISQTDQLQNSWQSCQQMYACQLEMCVVDDTLLPVVRTLDGQVIVHGAGGLQATVNCPSKIQHMKACGEFLYCLTEKAQLVLYYVKLNMDSISLSLISNVQCANKFQGTAGASTDDSIGANLIHLLPGGVGCLIYKKASSCNVQLYLSAENLLLDDIFEEEVIPVKIIFDISLLTVFTVFCNTQQQNTQNPEDLIANQAFVGSLCYSLADRSGPGVLFKKSPMVKNGISSLPVFTANCMSYHMANKHIMEAPPIPGIQNVHQVFAQLKQLPELLSTNTVTYIKQWNPLLPIQNSMVQAIEQNAALMDGSTASAGDEDHVQIQVQLVRKYPEYTKVPLPGQALSLLKGCVELNNLGLCDLALIFALRSSNLNLLKLTGDTALRVCDFEIADIAFGELSLVKAENPDYAHNEYSDVFTLQDQNQIAEYLQEVNKCQYLQAINSTTSAHQCDPSAFCMFLNQLCLQETELSTSMALSLVLAAPSDSGQNNSIQDQFLDQAEKLLLSSNKPGLALSFRVDALDWSTSSVLAKKISSPYVRGEILIQQAGELEGKGQFQEALDVCVSLLRQNDSQQQIDMFQLPLSVQPLFVGVVARSYAQLGKVQECREFALPVKKQNRYEARKGDPLNVLQRSRLCFDCAVVFTQQKRFGDAAAFYEAAAALAGRTFKKLSAELAGLGSGEISLYDVVRGGKQEEMLLFQLLPELAKVAARSYEKLYGAAGADVATDLQLLRQLDGDTEWRARNEVSQTLPNKLGDVVAPQDLAELAPAAALAKAVHCYIQQRLYTNAEALIDYVSDGAIIADLARVFMREDPQKALKLFKRAGKCVEMVECLLSLKKVQEAEDAVKEQKRRYDKAVMAGSDSGAEPGKLLEQEQELRQSAGVLASFFRRANAPKKGVFYSLLAELYDDAFELAIQTGSEAVLVRFVTAKAPADFLRRAAKFFASPDPNSTEKRPRNIEAAAKFLELSGGQGVDSAIKLLLNFGDGAGDIDRAIDLLRVSRGMVDYVLKYLQGGSDGVRKNPVYIFKLYLALDRFAEASKTAFLLADREMDNARFGRARALLLTCQQRLFQAMGGKCPQKFRERLILLHAVETGRLFASLGLHHAAGLCLYRASRSAALLGENAPGIVLGACVECWRAGGALRRQAYECACQMLREYPTEVPEKHARAVDTVVRKYKREEAAAAAAADAPLQCCQCGAGLAPGTLTCPDCQAVLPLDTASGAQVTCADMAECPHCRWLCSRLGLAELYSTEQVRALETPCPMCGRAVDLAKPQLVDSASFDAAVGHAGSGCTIDFADRDPKPLLVYEDSAVARRRYQAWVKEWETAGFDDL